jgi:hypothetical protein
VKTFDKVAAQGDVMLIRVDTIPENAVQVTAENGLFTIAHSETGHNHVCVCDVKEKVPNIRMYSGENPLIAWISVNRPTVLEHQRSFDTHEPIMIPPGNYEIRRQREYVPEGFRRVQD